MTPDYYKILGIERDATPDEVKKAYRRMAMRYHPDRAQDDPTAEDKFKEASEAYTVLSDEKKRAEYDHHGRVKGFEGGFRDFDVSHLQEVLGDFFGDFFRSRKRGTSRTNGKDLRYNLTVTLEESAFGTQKELRIPRKVRCTVCEGSGAQPGSNLRTCTACGGTGEVKLQQGLLSVRRTCNYCHGEGRIITDPCRNCFGTGKAEKEQVLTVKIPAGVGEGQRLKVAGKGAEGEGGGKSGDLFVHIHLEPHPVYERDGSHLRCTVPISASEAVLGCEVHVPTLYGPARMQIPPGTQSGRVFRLAGKGLLPIGAKDRGDELVTVTVETPTAPPRRVRELYEELLQLETAQLPRRRDFRRKVAELDSKRSR